MLVYVGASFLFLYLFLSLPLYLLISLFTYFFLSLFFISSLFLCVFLFTFFSIFLEPEPKLFHVTWVNKLHWHFIFYIFCGGKTKRHRQIRCSGVFRLFRCSGVLWGVLKCSRVFRCSRVPVFRCSRVPVFRCSGVPAFSRCHSFNHFWQCVTKSCKETITCQTN